MTLLKRILSYFNNANIMVKLMIGFLGVSLFLVLSIGFVANSIFSANLEESANEATLQAILQANSTIDSYIRSAENIMDMLSNNRQVLNTLKSVALTKDEMTSMRISTGNYLASIINSFPYFKGIALIANDNFIISNEMYRTVSTPVVEETWYRQCMAKPDTVLIQPKPSDRNLAYYNPVSADSIISLSMSIQNPSTGDILGVIVIDLNSSLLEETLRNAKVGKNGFIFVVDQHGECIYTPINQVAYRIRPEWLREKSLGIANKHIQGEYYQLIYSRSDYTGWKTVGVFSLNETLQQVVNFRYILVGVLLVALLLVGMFSVLFARGLTKPIRKLQALMKKAESGDFTVHFDVRYTDDVGKLGNSFNAMIVEIRHLVELIYRQQQQKRSAELKTLQAQIKPHFLYNTFDTIHWMARRHGAKDIEQIISALTKLYRIGLSKGNDVITIKEEIEHVRNYLIIQSIRYAEILQYQIECDQQVEKLYVQKLILQPLVENAIYHGIKNKEVPGMVSIRASIESECVLFEIADDGPGMTPQRLREILQRIHADDTENIGYGLYNVHKRIVLMHGKDYGLDIRSGVDGTTVSVRYPIQTDRKDEGDVQGIDRG